MGHDGSRTELFLDDVPERQTSQQIEESDVERLTDEERNERRRTRHTEPTSDDNPFGLNPADPYGRDDVLISDSTVHIPVGKPLKVVLRSKDVLHDFFVPQFRARMNLVPGLVTYFWFTPTRTGTFEILCAQLCGVGHYVMRGTVIVDDESTYETWLNMQPTFAQASASAQ